MVASIRRFGEGEAIGYGVSGFCVPLFRPLLEGLGPSLLFLVRSREDVPDLDFVVRWLCAFLLGSEVRLAVPWEERQGYAVWRYEKT